MLYINYISIKWENYPVPGYQTQKLSEAKQIMHVQEGTQCQVKMVWCLPNGTGKPMPYLLYFLKIRLQCIWKQFARQMEFISEHRKVKWLALYHLRSGGVILTLWMSWLLCHVTASWVDLNSLLLFWPETNFYTHLEKRKNSIERAQLRGWFQLRLYP